MGEGVVADLEAVEVRKEKHHEMVVETDQDWDSIDHPLMREAVIGETEAAVRERKEYLHTTYRDEYGGEFSHPLMTADSVVDFEELADDRFIYGMPDQIIEQIESIRERFELNQLALRFHHSGWQRNSSRTRSASSARKSSRLSTDETNRRPAFSTDEYSR